MKIKNLQTVAVYMGYEVHGFYLQPGEVSHDLPVALLSNKYLINDIEEGRIQVLLDERDRSFMAASGITLVEPVVKEKPSTVTVNTDTTTITPNSTTTIIEQNKSAEVKQTPKVNIIEVELTTTLAKMKSDKDKRAYLEGAMTNFSPQARAIATKIFNEMFGEQKNDQEKENESSVKPLPPIGAAKKIEQEMLNHPDDEPTVKEPGEPQMYIGESKDNAETKQKTAPKSVHQMNKLELLKYAVELGYDVTPAMKHSELKALVLKKRDGVE